jgi:hypothetical protein
MTIRRDLILQRMLKLNLLLRKMIFPIILAMTIFSLVRRIRAPSLLMKRVIAEEWHVIEVKEGKIAGMSAHFREEEAGVDSSAVEVNLGIGVTIPEEREKGIGDVKEKWIKRERVLVVVDGTETRVVEIEGEGNPEKRDLVVIVTAKDSMATRGVEDEALEVVVLVLVLGEREKGTGDVREK